MFWLETDVCDSAVGTRGLYPEHSRYFFLTMADTDPVSLWIEGLREADDSAVRSVWNHFASRLFQLARGRLASATKRVYDEDDAVQSMFRSVCQGFVDGRFSDLKDRKSLWRLMLVITNQKISNRHRFDQQQRRDIRRTVTDSVFCLQADADSTLSSWPSLIRPGGGSCECC